MTRVGSAGGLFFDFACRLSLPYHSRAILLDDLEVVSDMAKLPEIAEAMLDPQVYPVTTRNVELAQTQMSFLFLKRTLLPSGRAVRVIITCSETSLLTFTRPRDRQGNTIQLSMKNCKNFLFTDFSISLDLIMR